VWLASMAPIEIGKVILLKPLPGAKQVAVAQAFPPSWKGRKRAKTTCIKNARVWIILLQFWLLYARMEMLSM
jgi:hypothetical protein